MISNNCLHFWNLYNKVDSRCHKRRKGINSLRFFSIRQLSSYKENVFYTSYQCCMQSLVNDKQFPPIINCLQTFPLNETSEDVSVFYSDIHSQGYQSSSFYNWVTENMMTIFFRMVDPLKKGCPGLCTILYLIRRLKFFRIEESGLLFHCHYFHVHSDSKW